MKASRCDKLASTGIVGIRMTPKFRTSSQVLQSIPSLLNDQVTDRSHGERVTFAVDKNEVFDLIITLRSGTRYFFAPWSLAVGFVHRAELQHRSGGMPFMQLTSNLEPFSASIPSLSRLLCETYEMLGDHDRAVSQVGFVADTHVAFEDAPPGLTELIEKTVGLWGDNISVSLQIVSNINETDEFTDRCVHTINRVEDAGSSFPAFCLIGSAFLKSLNPRSRPKRLTN